MANNRATSVHIPESKLQELGKNPKAWAKDMHKRLDDLARRGIEITPEYIEVYCTHMLNAGAKND